MVINLPLHVDTNNILEPTKVALAEEPQGKSIGPLLVTLLSQMKS